VARAKAGNAKDGFPGRASWEVAALGCPQL